jgi:hypothetical protein
LPLAVHLPSLFFEMVKSGQGVTLHRIMGRSSSPTAGQPSLATRGQLPDESPF